MRDIEARSPGGPRCAGVGCRAVRLGVQAISSRCASGPPGGIAIAGRLLPSERRSSRSWGSNCESVRSNRTRRLAQAKHGAVSPPGWPHQRRCRGWSGAFGPGAGALPRASRSLVGLCCRECGQATAQEAGHLVDDANRPYRYSARRRSPRPGRRARCSWRVQGNGRFATARVMCVLRCGRAGVEDGMPLHAFVLNCTLKRSPAPSNTEALARS